MRCTIVLEFDDGEGLDVERVEPMTQSTPLQAMSV